MALKPNPSTIFLSDGRSLSYQVFGDPSLPETAPTVLYFHGFPGAHPEGGLINAEILKNHETRLIALSRPGYGKSTFYPKRTFTDWPKDVLDFTDKLGIDRFYAIGLSGGAPYVLACLKSLPKDRLLRAAIVSGAYPFCMQSKHTLSTNKKLAWASTTSWFFPLLPTIIEWYGGRFARDERRSAEFETYFLRLMAERHPKEVRCLDDPIIRKAAIDSCKESFRQGSRSMAWEAKMYNSEWDIPLDDLDGSRLDVWLGKQDKNFSVEEAAAHADTWGGCKQHVLEEEAHLSLIVNYADEILSYLLSDV